MVIASQIGPFGQKTHLVIIFRDRYHCAHVSTGVRVARCRSRSVSPKADGARPEGPIDIPTPTPPASGLLEMNVEVSGYLVAQVILLAVVVVLFSPPPRVAADFGRRQLCLVGAASGHPTLSLDPIARVDGDNGLGSIGEDHSPTPAQRAPPGPASPQPMALPAANARA